MKSLKDRVILYGITGSIAAYKAIEIIRRLRDREAVVNAVLTKTAQDFLPPLTLEAACGVRVYTDPYSPLMAHIELPSKADLFVVAPATANIIGKYASGIADDLLSTMLLAYSGQVLMAPAMNHKMYGHPKVQKNIEALKAEGVQFIGPETGPLACGETGKGRMANTEDILEAITAALSKKDLMGHRVLVTAGPTREPIDPVRYLSNRSSGKMGYAMASAAKARGAEVTLISGPVSLKSPYGVKTIYVETASEMYECVMKETKWATILVMVAAVADYTPVNVAPLKIEKQDTLTLQLQKTRDILSSVSALKERPFIVGFAAQTGPEIDKARAKLLEKGADVIFFNDLLEPGAGFQSNTNRVIGISKKVATPKEFPLMSKEQLSDCLFDYILEQLG